MTRLYTFKCTKKLVPEASRRSWYAEFSPGKSYEAYASDSGRGYRVIADDIDSFVTEEEALSHGELVERFLLAPLALADVELRFDRTFQCTESFTFGDGPLGEGRLIPVGQHPAALVDSEFGGMVVLDLARGHVTVRVEAALPYGSLSDVMSPPEVPASVGLSSSLASVPPQEAKKRGPKKKHPPLAERLRETKESVPKGLYRHFEGTLYRVTGYALHTETNKPLVLYQEAQSFDEEVFARPPEMFSEEVVDPQGVTTVRFRHLDDQ